MRAAIVLLVLGLGAGCVRRPTTPTAAVLDYVRSLEEEDVWLYRSAIDAASFRYTGPATSTAPGKLEFTADEELRDLPRLFRGTSLRFSTLSVEQRNPFELEVAFTATLFVYDPSSSTGAFELAGRWRFGLAHQADGVVITGVEELPSKQRSGATFAFVKWLHSGRFGVKAGQAAACRAVKSGCTAEELIDAATGAALGTRLSWTDAGDGGTARVSYLDPTGKKLANFNGL